MTPDEVFAQLRDIHVPRVATDATSWVYLDPRPLVAFAVLIALLVILPRLGRWRKRQELRAKIAGLVELPPSEQRDQLACLARDLPMIGATDPPEALFQAPPSLGPHEAERLRKWVQDSV